MERPKKACVACNQASASFKCDDCGETHCAKCNARLHIGEDAEFQGHKVFSLDDEFPASPPPERAADDASVLVSVVIFQFLLPIMLLVLGGIGLGRIPLGAGVQAIAAAGIAIFAAMRLGVPLEVFTGVGA